MRDYGKVHTSFWTSANIRSLSDDGRALALYLLTCPHGTIAGVFRLPDGYACEDLQWTPEKVKTTLSELFANGFATRCEVTKWVVIHKHFEWNPPENPNQKKAAAKVAAQVPDSCSWKAVFIGEHGVFLGLTKETDSEPLPNPSETLSQPVTVTGTVAETRSKTVSPPDGVSITVWQDFKTLRTKLKAPITQTSLEGIQREADKAGLSLDDALKTCCERSWRGFKAEWMMDDKAAKSTYADRQRAMADELTGKNTINLGDSDVIALARH